MQVMHTKTPMLRTLSTFAARDGKSSCQCFSFLEFCLFVFLLNFSLAAQKLSPQHHTDPFLGIPSLWDGLSASILRQSTYSTARFGLFTILTQHLKQAQSQSQSQNQASPLPLSTTIFCAAVAGGLAGVVGNPAEVVLVRMCADGARPPSERYNYPDAARGLLRIAATEGGPQGGVGRGLRTLFGRGLGATVVRSVLMNVGQIAP